MGLFKKESAEERQEKLIKEKEEREARWQQEWKEQLEKEEQEKREKEELINTIENYKNNSKKIFKLNAYLYGILTNDDKLVFIYEEIKPHKELEEKRIEKIIDIKDILKVDIICTTKTKQVHNWWNIMVFTMEQRQQIESMILKIITLDEIFRFKLDVNEYISRDRQVYSDNMEILMTYLERKIKSNEI